LDEPAGGARAVISRTRIGPGPAARVRRAGSAAGSSDRVRRHLEIAVVAADAIDREFDRRIAGSHHAGTLDPRHTARIGTPGRHLAFEPTDSVADGAGRIGEAPGAAAGLAIAARCANGRVAESH